MLASYVPAVPFMTLRRRGICAARTSPLFSRDVAMAHNYSKKWPISGTKPAHFRGRKWVIAAVKLVSGVLLVPGLVPEIMRFFRFGAKAAPSRFRVRKCGLAGTLAARDVGSAALLVPRGHLRK